MLAEKEAIVYSTTKGVDNPDIEDKTCYNPGCDSGLLVCELKLADAFVCVSPPGTARLALETPTIDDIGESLLVRLRLLGERHWR
ncbi:MAG: hypothetical protein J07HQX50_00195 [Haloquadratum sp. J07HQX50]|nr:MAG: hypothetical protein J07HQX50_00195 [Haloquadratum sp. J07HQX50]